MPPFTLDAMRRSLITLSEANLVQGFLLVGLLCVLPIHQLRSFTAVVDPDIWWHVRVGQWILEHHSFPHQGIFSFEGATRTWAAYSWGFEVIVAALNMLFGVKGIMFLALFSPVAIVLVLFLVARTLSGGFLLALSLASLPPLPFALHRPT